MNLVRSFNEKQHKFVNDKRFNLKQLVESLIKEIPEIIIEDEKFLKIDFSKMPRTQLDNFTK